MKIMKNGTLVMGSIAIGGFPVGSPIVELLTDERMWKAEYLLELLSVQDTIEKHELRWKPVGEANGKRRYLCTNFYLDNVTNSCNVNALIEKEFIVDNVRCRFDVPTKKELKGTPYENAAAGVICNLDEFGIVSEWSKFIPVLEINLPRIIQKGVLTLEIGGKVMPVLSPTSPNEWIIFCGHSAIDFKDYKFDSDYKIQWLPVDDWYIADRTLLCSTEERITAMMHGSVTIDGIQYELQKPSEEMFKKAAATWGKHFCDGKNEVYKSFAEAILIPALVPKKK